MNSANIDRPHPAPALVADENLVSTKAVSMFNRSLALGFTLAIVGQWASAAAGDLTAWDIDVRALLSSQANEDIMFLPRTIRTTKPAICTFEKEWPALSAKRMLSVRISSGNDFDTSYQRVWLLRRTSDKATVTHILMAAPDRVFATYTREVSLQKWDAVYEKFKSHKQRPPTPSYKERQPLVNGQTWPRGYAGIVNTFEDGKTRTYLLATDDIWSLSVQNLLEEAICRLLAGMHCRVGAQVKNGWAEEALASLLNLETMPPITATQDVVNSIDEACLPR